MHTASRTVVFSNSFWGLLFLVLTLHVGCNEPMPKTVVYPSPGNLAQIEGLSESDFFKVKVEADSAFVYYGKDEAPDTAYDGKGISFLSFEMSYGPVNLEVSTTEPIDSFSVTPFNGSTNLTNSTHLHVSFNEPDKLLLTVFLKKSGKQQLVLSAEMPDWKKPKVDERGVLYLKPGIHQKGENWDPFTEQIHTLYLEGGAVLQTTLNVKGGKSAHIKGRGIVTQAFAKHASRKDDDAEPWFARCQGIAITNTKKVKIEGITVMNSPGCQLAVNNADELLMNNVKLCGFGEQDNDGLHLFSRNVIAEDLLVISSGDRITLNGLYDNQTSQSEGDKTANKLTGCIAENIQIRDFKAYGVKNGADIMLSKNANHDLRTVLIENVASLAPTSGGFIAANHHGKGGIFDVVIVNSKVYHSQLINVQIKKGVGQGKLRSLYLDNIDIDAQTSQIGSAIHGFSPERNVTDVIFTNLSAQGNFVKEFTQMGIKTNPFVSDIQVKVEIRDEY